MNRNRLIIFFKIYFELYIVDKNNNENIFNNLIYNKKSISSILKLNDI